MACQFPQLLLAIGAGGGDDVGAGGSNLFRLGFADHFHAERVGLVQRDQPAPPATAVVESSVGLHFDEIFDETAQDVARLIHDPPRA
jgi:hypothetical protein